MTLRTHTTAARGMPTEWSDLWVCDIKERANEPDNDFLFYAKLGMDGTKVLSKQAGGGQEMLYFCGMTLFLQNNGLATLIGMLSTAAHSATSHSAKIVMKPKIIMKQKRPVLPPIIIMAWQSLGEEQLCMVFLKDS